MIRWGMFVVTSLHNVRRRLSAGELREHAREHSFDLSDHRVEGVDRGRMFVCETVTPLYYCPVYRELPEAARRRYNQLVGLFTNEIVTFFETKKPPVPNEETLEIFAFLDAAQRSKAANGQPMKLQ